MVGECSRSIKLVLILDHGMRKVSKEMHDQRWMAPKSMLLGVCICMAIPKPISAAACVNNSTFHITHYRFIGTFKHIPLIKILFFYK